MEMLNFVDLLYGKSYFQGFLFFTGQPTSG